MRSFSYHAPDSVSALLATLSDAKKNNEPSQILAGGTDLLVQMKTHDRKPRHLVDIKKVPEATRIEIKGQDIYIGAAVPAAEITAHSGLQKLFPGLVESVYYIGSSQIQSRATIGGNLSNASPAGDTIPALIANGARCLVGSPDGERQVAVEDFTVDVQRNCLAPDECLLGLYFSQPSGRTSDAYIRFTPRTEMDIAVVGVGVSLTLDENNLCVAARVGVGAMASTVICADAVAEVLTGTDLNQEVLDSAGEVASQVGTPISDKRGSAEFRRALAGVLVKRTVKMAHQRAMKI